MLIAAAAAAAANPLLLFAAVAAATQTQQHVCQTGCGDQLPFVVVVDRPIYSPCPCVALFPAPLLMSHALLAARFARIDGVSTAGGHGEGRGRAERAK